MIASKLTLAVSLTDLSYPGQPAPLRLRQEAGVQQLLALVDVLVDRAQSAMNCATHLWP